MSSRTLFAAAFALAVSVSIPVAAQLPRTDTTFAGAGQLPLPWTRSNLDRDAIALGPNGEVFMASEEENSIRLLKLDTNGVPVPEYVGAGIARLAIDSQFDLASIAPQPDGSVLLGGRRDVIRVDPTGRIDRAFGDQGRIRVPFVPGLVCAAARVTAILPQGGGWIVVATNFFVDTSVPLLPVERACTFIGRLKANGTPDLDFGTNGNRVRNDFHAFDVVIKDTYLEILGRYAEESRASIERVGFDGRMIESFGNFGSLELSDTGAPARVSDGRILADGSIILVGSRDGASLTLYRYKPDRSIDPAFAGVGRTVVLLRNQDSTFFERQAPRVLPVADGGFIVRARTRQSSPATSFNEDLYKVDARGLPDASFGSEGYARHRSKGDSRIVAWMMQPDGYLVYSAAVFTQPLPAYPAYTTVTPFLTRLQAVPDIVEFFNRITRHYFIAYDGLEAAAIDGGAAGPGWERTTHGFRPGGTTAVCRFYNGGANTHFFTIEPGECEVVKHSPGWTYEGLGFYGTRLVKGSCPANLRAVTRLFNNRQGFNDSNHRYVTDATLIPVMVAQGWALEGPVFCVKP